MATFDTLIQLVRCFGKSFQYHELTCPRYQRQFWPASAVRTFERLNHVFFTQFFLHLKKFILNKITKTSSDPHPLN